MRDESPQPPQRHRHVRPEHAAADMGLVDDDQGEPEEEVGPPGVVGQERQVQHVRVRHHEVRVLADQRAFRARRVAVVDRRLHLRDRQRADGAELIPREGLRREEVQRGGGRALNGLRCERQVVDQGLPAGRSRRHHQVAVGGQDLEPFGLVRVDAVDPHEGHPVLHQRRDPARERRDGRAPSRELAHVDERLRVGSVGRQRGEERARVHPRDATGATLIRGRVRMTGTIDERGGGPCRSCSRSSPR